MSNIDGQVFLGVVEDIFEVAEAIPQVRVQQDAEPAVDGWIPGGIGPGGVPPALEDRSHPYSCVFMVAPADDDVLVPQVGRDIATQINPQVRVQQRIVERLTDALVPQVTEENAELAKVIPQVRVQQDAGPAVAGWAPGEIGPAGVSPAVEDRSHPSSGVSAVAPADDEVHVPQVDRDIATKINPQVRVQQRIVKQLTDALVPQVTEESAGLPVPRVLAEDRGDEN